MRSLVWSIGALLAWSATAQERVTADQFNAWAYSNVQLQVGAHWWAVQEVHWRRSEGFQHPMQTGLLFSAEYRWGRWSLAPGYTRWWSNPYGAFPTVAMQREHRAWLQVGCKHAVGKGAMEHRARLEERFLERHAAAPEGPRSLGYEPVWRVRYRIQYTLPLNDRADAAGELSAVLFQETFVRFGDPAFDGLLDQSRSALSLGWRYSSALRLLAGYQFQYLVRANSAQRENDHTLLLGVQLRLPRHATPAAPARPTH